MEELRDKLRVFVEERNWDQYHSPKNLAISLSVEANELLELFMWISEEESKNLSPEKINRVREEIGDITINLLNLCTKFDLDPIECAGEKLELIMMKYPVNRSKGSSKKYNEL